MSAALIPFDFESHAVRTVMIDGLPCFVGVDVCRAIEIGKPSNAMARLDDDERVPVVVDTLGGKQTMTGVTESGLYALILTSRKPAAKRFRKWVTSEVIPAIRRDGTLTNLYNARPAWLDHAHRALDEAVAEAYGWGDAWRAGLLTDDEILARLFRLNQERAAVQGKGFG
ncbi:MAG: BRO family protein [Rhodobacterales bacterium]|nr:BRO family protein [Rhodobacterales bacterium]